jgi:TP901 family phage tail tape measure protein
MAIESAKIRATLDVGFDNKSLNRATRDVDRAMNRMAQQSKASAQSVKAMTPVVAGIGGAIVASFAIGAKAAATFEQQFADVKKTLDVRGEAQEVERQFSNIAKQIRNIAKFSPATIQSLNQIASIGGQLGIQANNIVKFTDTIQKLTVATNLSADQAALSLARLQKITGLATNDLDNLASTLVKLGNNFATTESEIITAATQIATATAGTSSEFNNAAVDALAYATALRAIGQPAQAGSTAIIRLIQVVDRVAKTGGSQLEELAKISGMTIESFKSLEEVDPNRAIALFLAGLGDFEKQGGDAVGVLEDLGLGQIRSRRALLALSRAQEEQGGKSVPLLVAAMDMANQEFLENNALLTEAERKYQTVISQTQILKNTVSDAGIEFGTQFLPQVNNIIQGLIAFATATADIGKTVGLLTKFLGTAFGIIQFTKAARNNFKILAKDTKMYAAALAVATGEQAKFTTAQKAYLAGVGGKRGGLVFNTLNPLAKPSKVTDMKGDRLQEQAVGRINVARKQGIVLIQKTIQKTIELLGIQERQTIQVSKQLQLTAGAAAKKTGTPLVGGTPFASNQAGPGMVFGPPKPSSVTAGSVGKAGVFKPSGKPVTDPALLAKKAEMHAKKITAAINEQTVARVRQEFKEEQHSKKFIVRAKKHVTAIKEQSVALMQYGRLNNKVFVESIAKRTAELKSIQRTTLAQKMFSKGTLELGGYMKAMQKAGMSYWTQINLMTKQGITLQQMYNIALGKTVPITQQAAGAMASLSLGIQSVATAIKGTLAAVGRMAGYLAAFGFIFQIIERVGAEQRAIEGLAEGSGSIVENQMEIQKAMKDLETLKDIRAEEVRSGADDVVIETIDNRIKSIEDAIRRGKINIKKEAGDLLLPILESARTEGGDVDLQLKATAAILNKDLDKFSNEFAQSMSKLVIDIESGRVPTINSVIQALISDESAFGPDLTKTLRKINREFEGGILGAIDTGFSKLFFGPDTEELIDSSAGRFGSSITAFIDRLAGRDTFKDKVGGGGVGVIFGMMDETLEAQERILEGKGDFGDILGDISADEAFEVAGALDLIADTLVAVSGLSLKEIIDGGEVQFAKTSALVQARIKYLNSVQESFVAAGALDFNEQIDAAKDYEGAAQLVAKTTQKQFDGAADGIESMREELGLTEEMFVSIMEQVENQLQKSMDRAVNIFSTMPDKMMGTFEDFTLRLKKKLKLEQEFASMVKELSTFAPLLAQQFAQAGPAAIEQLRKALSVPTMAGAVEAQILQNVGPEMQDAVRKALAEQIENGEVNEEAYGLGGDLTLGIVDGIESKKDELTGVFRDVFVDAVEEARDYLKSRSPSRLTFNMLGVPMIDGIIGGIKSKTPQLKEALEMVINALPGTIAEVTAQAQRDFASLTSLTNAMRGVAEAQKSRITSEHELLRVMRDRASFQERLKKNEDALAKAEISGRAGNITVDEEITLLRNKLNIQKQIDAINGKRSASENLAIVRKEEEIADLRALNQKGVVSNLELAAAEEDLAKMKGEDLSDDEKKLRLLELTQAQNQNNEAIEKAKAVSDELIRLREENIRLIEEEELMDVSLTIATNNLGDAKERVVSADLQLESARANFNLQIASDGEFMTRLFNLTEQYNSLGNAVSYVYKNQNDLSGLDTRATKPIRKEVKKQVEDTESDADPVYTPPEEDKTKAPPKKVFSTQVPGYGSLPDYIKEQIQKVDEKYLYGLPDYITGMAMGGRIKKYGMGGRVKKYGYGGRGDPMRRALVGEYGPEEVKFIPGNGFLVKPLSDGRGGTVVNSLNVNVTGVPSDPIAARKAAQQISKALRKLDKEGSSGTGLRRN